jgi:hypothetical protein
MTIAAEAGTQRTKLQSEFNHAGRHNVMNHVLHQTHLKLADDAVCLNGVCRVEIFVSRYSLQQTHRDLFQTKNYSNQQANISTLNDVFVPHF